MLAIYKREMKSYFLTPIGYIFCSVYSLVSGLAFSYSTLLSQSTQSLPTYFIIMIALLVVLIPLLTMKLFSDDRKMRTEQCLLTAPVTLTGMVMGKYFAALSVYAATFFVNSLNFALLYRYGAPNGMSILSNITGMFFIGCAFIATGLFLSSLTENQLIAALSSMGVIASFVGVIFIVDKIGIVWIRTVVKWFSVLNRYAAFSNEQFDITAIIYYISLTAVFIFLTVRVYEKRRWS